MCDSSILYTPMHTTGQCLGIQISGIWHQIHRKPATQLATSSTDHGKPSCQREFWNTLTTREVCASQNLLVCRSSSEHTKNLSYDQRSRGNLTGTSFLRGDASEVRIRHAPCGQDCGKCSWRAFHRLCSHTDLGTIRAGMVNRKDGEIIRVLSNSFRIYLGGAACARGGSYHARGVNQAVRFQHKST